MRSALLSSLIAVTLLGGWALAPAPARADSWAYTETTSAPYAYEYTYGRRAYSPPPLAAATYVSPPAVVYETPEPVYIEAPPPVDYAPYAPSSYTRVSYGHAPPFPY